MLFNSFDFLVFFIVITLLYYILDHKYRWALLLAGSCFFYMSFIPVYILILGFTIVIDYVAGIYIEKSEGKRRKRYLVMSIVANVGVLFVFKYYNFINDSLSSLLGFAQVKNNIPYLHIILPIGLSFHTFQAMSYTIEVYRGNQPAEKHFGIYSLYVMFYPQLVAGPIERPQNILHQLKEKVVYKQENMVTGIQMILWGLFKKAVVADRLAVLVDKVYAHPGSHGGLTLFVASVCFSIQIYCDFSGYSDMAIGTARTLGIDLMKNFNRPYTAKSVTEFWQRWHISLSSWFRDYLYIPLGGNRLGEFKTIRNVFIVFLISGLWHGANWTFVIWGGLHGLMVLIERLVKTKKKHKKPSYLLGLVRTLWVFLLVNFAWIFFRASNIHDVAAVYKGIFTNFHINKGSITECLLLVTGDSTSLGFMFVSACMAILMFFMDNKTGIAENYAYSFNKTRNYAFYLLVLFCILFFGAFTSNSFIYFQF